MGKKLLVIDDSKTARRELVRIAQEHNLKVFEAENGRYALEITHNRQDIALILCDLNMPEMNGLEFIEALRQDPHHHDTPVVLMSKDGSEDLGEIARIYRIHDVISKPAQGKYIRDLLSKFYN